MSNQYRQGGYSGDLDKSLARQEVFGVLKKTCPYCHQDSYSSTDYGKWICPYCHKDISSVEVQSEGFNAGTSKPK